MGVGVIQEEVSSIVWSRREKGARRAPQLFSRRVACINQLMSY